MRLHVGSHREHEAHGVLHQQDSVRLKRGKFAYVTLMCEDEWLTQMRVLTYSWKRTKSPFPLIIMTLPWVKDDSVIEELKSYGAVIKPVPYLNVPFKRANGKSISFEKACRYSKLHLWDLTEYDRVVYLDPLLLLVQNIDELFQYDAAFSGVKVVGDDFNTGLFVTVPGKDIYKDMLVKYPQSPLEHRGEQGFLNWFFSKHDTRVISARYNTVIRQKVLFV